MLELTYHHFSPGVFIITDGVPSYPDNPRDKQNGGNNEDEYYYFLRAYFHDNLNNSASYYRHKIRVNYQSGNKELPAERYQIDILSVFITLNQFAMT